mgnify:CR=1 FL=1
MDNNQNYRIKASMIVFQLEQDLGTYITDHADSILDISEHVVNKISSNINTTDD